MTVSMTLDIPEEVEGVFQGRDIGRELLEAFAVQGYLKGRLSLKQVRLLLGLESRWEAEDFLAAHDAWPGLSAEDLQQELAAMSRLQPA